MPKLKAAILALSVGLSSLAYADALPPDGLVRLSASVREEVANDQLTALLFVEQEHKDANQLMMQMNRVLADAGAAARKFKDVEVRTSAFSTYPLYDNGRAIRGWRARADLTLTGPMSGGIAEAVAVLQSSLVVGQLTPGVSERRRDQVREDLSLAAISAFRARSAAYAKAFGAPSWELHEASVEANLGQLPRPMMAMAARGMAEVAAVSVEAGNSTVEVTVVGSIRLTAPTQEFSR